MTKDERDKKEFELKLKGATVPRDVMGTPIFPGDYILYSVAVQSSARLKLGLVITMKDRGLKVHGAERVYFDRWELGIKPGFIHRYKDSAIVIDNPSPDIIELFQSIKVE